MQWYMSHGVGSRSRRENPCRALAHANRRVVAQWRGMARLRVGIDLVQVSRIAESIATFGERFLRRVFTEREVAYASSSPDVTAERLAARFAAKEAAKKALGLDGVGWNEIEVVRMPSGACELLLHGRARAAAEPFGAADVAVSMSHEGDHATAVVIALAQ
ncbi:MAG: acpS [Myxococcales bacterium]|nr:acpS [Myxococcales bacterium]